MFNTISWHSYWTSLAITTTIYYFILVLLFYRKEIKTAFLTKSFTKTADQSFIVNEDEFKAPSGDTEEGIVYACMDELNAFFEEAKKRKWNKNEMVYSLQLIMKKYPSIKTSRYKQSVSNVLINQCEHICSIHLNAEELEHVWLD
jgi:hypothetical protein